MNKALLTLLTMTACCAGPDPERGEPSRSDVGVEDLLGGALLPDRDEKKLVVERALADEIEATLEILPGVKESRVHLVLPDTSLLSRDRDAPGSALVVMLVGEEGPSPEEIARIVAAAAPPLRPRQIVVEVRVLPSSSREVVDVGPFKVTASSAPAARWLLAGLLGLCILLAFGLVYSGLCLRKLRRSIGEP